MKYWVSNLDSSDLIATIIWSWIKGLDVFSLSKIVNKKLIEKKENINVNDLLSIKWIWVKKAISIISSFELAKRYFLNDGIFINSIDDILRELHEYRNKKQEYLISITLDWANRIINKRVVTIGLLNRSLIHPREVFADAIFDRANSIILIHNHPSNTNEPSDADIKVTNRLLSVADLIWISLFDHIIITKNSYYSFRENALI